MAALTSPAVIGHGEYVERFTSALVLVVALLVAACGATEDPEVQPPRLVVAYVDDAGDVVIRSEPEGRSWRFTSDGVVFGMSWSPNADRLLITERLGEDWQLRLLEAGGFSTVAVLPLDERPGHRVTWRADGAAFALSGARSTSTYSRTGRALWSVDESGIPLGWSPDGRWFALNSESIGTGGRLTLTDGTLTHHVTPADLGLTAGSGQFARAWMIDGSMLFGVSALLGGALETETAAWKLEVSADGVELGEAVDPSFGVNSLLASEARDADGELARTALVIEVGGPEAVRGDFGGFRWVSARYDDSGGHHRVFAWREGATLGDERITIDFGDDPFPQIAVSARAPDEG